MDEGSVGEYGGIESGEEVVIERHEASEVAVDEPRPCGSGENEIGHYRSVGKVRHLGELGVEYSIDENENIAAGDLPGRDVDARGNGSGGLVALLTDGSESSEPPLFLPAVGKA
jgi:hypothetical protein